MPDDFVNDIEKERRAARIMLAALREIYVINDEDQGACRRRMGTRRGNSMVAAQHAIAAAEAAGIKVED